MTNLFSAIKEVSFNAPNMCWHFTENKISYINPHIAHEYFTENVIITIQKRNWGGSIFQRGSDDNILIKLNCPESYLPLQYLNKINQCSPVWHDATVLENRKIKFLHNLYQLVSFIV
jgi:hypothetical protein